MTHEEKVERFRQLLRERGYWTSNAIPPVWRGLWRVGVAAPPPYFLSYPLGAACAGLPFGVLWGLFMRLTVWHGPGFPLALVVSAAVACGVGFGLAMAGFWRYQGKKLGLPAWQDFPGE